MKGNKIIHFVLWICKSETSKEFHISNTFIILKFKDILAFSY